MENIIKKHISEEGNLYTQEFIASSNCGGCIEIVRDSFGQTLDTSGSGGIRPWDKKQRGRL